MCEFHDYRVDGIDKALIQDFLSQYSIAELVNRRSTTWRNLSAEQKHNVTIDLIVAHPTLLQRPIVAIEGQYYIGYFPDKWQ